MTTIEFGIYFHTIATTTVYPASHVDQRLQLRFQPAVTGCPIIAENTTADTPFLEENDYDFSKLLPLLCNLTLNDDTLIARKTL